MIELAQRWFSERSLGFIDIGARGGIHELVASIAPWVSVLGFEPDPIACQLVNSETGPWAAALCLPIALSDVNGSATLHRCKVPTNDSLHPINQKFVDRYRMEKFAQIGSIPVFTQTLDVALVDTPTWGEFIKLDTQGTEYEILAGGSRTLKEHTAAIYCEVEFAQIYEGQKLFSDIDLLLRDYGFSFLGFDNMSYRSRTPWKGRERLLHADALFIKDPLEQKMSERQMQVAAMAASLCGYKDFAKEIMYERII